MHQIFSCRVFTITDSTTLYTRIFLNKKNSKNGYKVLEVHVSETARSLFLFSQIFRLSQPYFILQIESRIKPLIHFFRPSRFIRAVIYTFILYCLPFSLVSQAGRACKVIPS